MLSMENERATPSLFEKLGSVSVANSVTTFGCLYCYFVAPRALYLLVGAVWLGAPWIVAGVLTVVDSRASHGRVRVTLGVATGFVAWSLFGVAVCAATTLALFWLFWPRWGTWIG